jgi:hypothetical protein
MNKNFALYLKKGNLQQKHRTPPVFDRNKYLQVKHKTPPVFKRPLELKNTQHKTPPPFIRPGNSLKTLKNQELFLEMTEKSNNKVPNQKNPSLSQPSTFPLFSDPEKHPKDSSLKTSSTLEKIEKSSIFHKIPPIFLRSKFEDQEKKLHKKPPIFSKFPASIRSEFFQNRLKNSGSWSFADTVSEDAKDSFLNESSAEMSPGFFDLRKSSKASIVLSRSSMADSSKLKEDLKHVNASLESAILNLHSEVQEFPSFKEGFETKELCNYESSGYSSSLEKENEKIPRPNFNYFGILSETQEKPKIFHKTPPVFDRKAKEKQKTIPTIVSSLSNSGSISPISSASNSPDSRISRILENSPGNHILLNDSANAFISGISEVSPEKSNKSLLKLKSSFIGESEKSKNFSPFVSNNLFEKSFVIPMKPVSYFERSTEASGLRFFDFSQLPQVPEYEKGEFNYPSVRKGARGSSNTIFSQAADLPDNIRLNVNLSHSLKQSVKPSKYSLNVGVSSKEIEFMAKKLAKELVEREDFY